MTGEFSKKLQGELSIIRPFHGDCTFEAMLDEDGVQAGSGLDWRGRELPDGTPLAPPVGFSQGPSLVDFIQRTIRQQMSAAAASDGYETEEEANDFAVGDDYDPNVPYFEEAYQPYGVPEAPAPSDTASPGGAPANDSRSPPDAGKPAPAEPVKPSPAIPPVSPGEN